MKKKITLQVSNILCAIFGIAIGVTAIWITMGFKQFTNVPVGPEVFPRIMSIALILCSVVLLIQNLIKKDAGQAPPLSLRNRGIQRMLIIAGITLAFYLLLDIVGYLILAPLLLFASMFVMDYRNYKMMILISIGVSLAVFLLFRMVLVIDLPSGLLSFLF